MTRSRWIRRAIVAGVVGGAVTIVAAASGPSLSAQPPVIDVHLPLNTPGSGSGQLVNSGDTAATVSSLGPDPSCAALGVSSSAMPPAPFTIAGMNATHLITVGCTPSGYGIRRCQQHAKDVGNVTLASFTGLCITEGNSMFMPSSSSLIFPMTPVGQTSATQTITIANPFGNPQSSLISIQLGDQDGNFQVSAPCLANGPGCDAPIVVIPGGSFQVTLACSPQSAGPHSTPLYIVGDAGTKLMPAVMLSCSGGTSASTPAISVNPPNVTLMRPVGAPTGMTTVHVSNIGTADLMISSIVATGLPDWQYTTSAPCSAFPCTVSNIGGGFDLTVMFDPAAIGNRDKTLTINSNDPNNPMFQLLLHGVGQGATLALASNLGSPPMLDLGTSPIGVQTSATFDLRNDGNLVLDPVNLAMMQPGSELSVSPNPTMIGAAGLRSITVFCTPSAATVYQGTLGITAPNALSGSPISIAVRCTGTSGNLFAVPSSVQLGEIRTGSPRVTRTIMLKTAGSPLTITSDPQLSPSVAGMAVGAPSSRNITMAAPVSFDLTVDATTDHDLTTSIQVTAGSQLPIPVTGKVVTAKIEVAQSVAIGSFCIGQPTTSSAARLTATGTATIGLGSQPVMNKMATSPFQLAYTAPVSYPYQLPSGQSATVDVTPLRQMMKGTQTDEIVWTTDVAGELAPRTTVTADFVADGGAIAPQLADFGTVRLRQVGDPKVIKIQNCGTEPMALAGPFIDPGSEFRDDSPAPLPAMLAPNQIATINVNFAPTKLGTRMATLTVDSSKGMLSVALLGIGGDDPDHKTELVSPYGCSSGETTTAWPALTVLLVLRRRRRR